MSAAIRVAGLLSLMLFSSHLLAGYQMDMKPVRVLTKFTPW